MAKAAKLDGKASIDSNQKYDPLGRALKAGADKLVGTNTLFLHLYAG